MIVLTVMSCSITRDTHGNAGNSSRQFALDLVTAEVDGLGNVIALSANNTITRFNRLNGSSVQYSDNRLGRIDVVDSRNPLEVLVFFRSYGIVRWLDSSLSVIEEANLQNSNIVHVCSANDGNLWVFDENSQRLYKRSRKQANLVESNRMSDLGLQKMQIVKMRESNNRLVVLTEESGFLVFDNFGQFQRKFPAFSGSDFQLIDNLLIEYANSMIKITDLNRSFSAPKEELLEAGVGAFGLRVWESDYFLLFKDGIDVVSQR